MIFGRKKRDEQKEAKEEELDRKFAAEYLELCEKYGRELIAVNFAVKRISKDAGR